MDSTDSSPLGHPSTDHDDLETHYAALERLKPPHGCIVGVVYIGHLVEGEDGQEVEVYEAVPTVQEHAVGLVGSGRGLVGAPALNYA